MLKANANIAPTATGLLPSTFDRPAIFRGALFGAAGALGMVTWIGFCAVLSMASERLSPETMTARLADAWDLRLMVVASYLLFGLLAGYVAARAAKHNPLRQALAAGAMSAAISGLVSLICGAVLPGAVLVATLTMIVPLAGLGGFLAQPGRSPACPPVP